VEYNGLTLDDFKQYLNELEELTMLNESIADLIYHYGKQHNDYCEFYYPTSINMVVRLLSIIMDDQRGWIAYWCFERNFGKLHGAATVTDEDGTVYPLETAEHLWNILAAERRTKGAQ